MRMLFFVLMYVYGARASSAQDLRRDTLLIDGILPVELSPASKDTLFEGRNSWVAVWCEDQRSTLNIEESRLRLEVVAFAKMTMDKKKMAPAKAGHTSPVILLRENSSGICAILVVSKH